jgi:hypothetical protein
MSSSLFFLSRVFTVAGCSQSYEKANILLFHDGRSARHKASNIPSKYDTLKAEEHQDLLLAFCLQKTEFSARTGSVCPTCVAEKQGQPEASCRRI